MSNPDEDSLHAPNPNHNVNSTYILGHSKSFFRFIKK